MKIGQMKNRRKGGLARAGVAGSAYLCGAATGIALALPLAAVAFTPERLPAPVHVQAFTVQGPVAPAAFRAPPLVNRAAKGPRLDITIPPSPAAASVPAVSPAVSPALARDVPAPVPLPAGEPAPASKAPAGATPGAMPRGCLSALGGIRPNIPTENLTVCIADISTID